MPSGLTASGNVGIGLTNPAAKLSVNVVSGNFILDLVNGSEGTFALRTYNHGTASAPGLAFTQGLYYNTTENSSIRFYRGPFSSDGYLALATNATNRLTITSAGNVLIATTTDAGYKLDVNGQVRATAFFESSDIRFKNIIETNPDIKALGIDVIKFTRTDDDTNAIRYGYSAQQVQEVIPEAVVGEDKLSVNYMDVHTLKIAALERRIAELEAKLNKL
jgi:hypothetical protein